MNYKILRKEGGARVNLGKSPLLGKEIRKGPLLGECRERAERGEKLLRSHGDSKLSGGYKIVVIAQGAA